MLRHPAIFPRLLPLGEPLRVETACRPERRGSRPEWRKHRASQPHGVASGTDPAEWRIDDRELRHPHHHALLSHQRRLQRLPPRRIVELRVIVCERLLRALNVQRREYRAFLPEDLPSLLLENG